MSAWVGELLIKRGELALSGRKTRLAAEDPHVHRGLDRHWRDIPSRGCSSTGKVCNVVSALQSKSTQLFTSENGWPWRFARDFSHPPLISALACHVGDDGQAAGPKTSSSQQQARPKHRLDPMADPRSQTFLAERSPRLSSRSDYRTPLLLPARLRSSSLWRSKPRPGCRSASGAWTLTSPRMHQPGNKETEARAARVACPALWKHVSCAHDFDKLLTELVETVTHARHLKVQARGQDWLCYEVLRPASLLPLQEPKACSRGRAYCRL